MNDRTARRRAQVADEIVAAAEKIVIDGGPPALTAKALATAVGVTPGALYKHFPSLDAVLARVQARVIRDLADALAVATRADDPVAAVAVAGATLVAFARRDPRRYGLLATMLATPDPLVGDAAAADVVPIAIAALSTLRDRLAAARARGALGPGDDTQRLLALWAAAHGASQLGKLARFSPEASADRVARTAITALLVGWGARPAAVEAAYPSEVP